MNRASRRLEAAMEVSSRAGERLRSSIVDDGILLSRATEAVHVEPDIESLRVLDAFVQRYQELYEHMTYRLYPAIYRAEQYGDRPPPPRRLFNWLEELKLVDSARAWNERSEIRNRLVHEYPLDASDRAVALKAAVTEPSNPLGKLERAMSYIAHRDLLEAGDAG